LESRNPLFCIECGRLVAEVEYPAWTEDNLVREIVYEGMREDKLPTNVRRPILHPQPPQ
jgi:ATP-dependent DNA ligase